MKFIDSLFNLENKAAVLTGGGGIFAGDGAKFITGRIIPIDVGFRFFQRGIIFNLRKIKRAFYMHMTI
jgi:hypothetical protein